MADYLVHADYHTHTRYSHGKGSVRDNVHTAVSRGLKAVAITDHGPASMMVGISERCIEDIKRDIEELEVEIEVLLGVEANIIGLGGQLDVRCSLMADLDILLAGLHPGTLGLKRPDHAVGFLPVPLVSRRRRMRALLRNTEAVTAALQTNDIDILVHPGLYYEVDIEEVAEACWFTNTLFEINSCHGWPPVDLLRQAARTDVQFVIGSDAHRPGDVGAVVRGIELARRAGIDPAQIANAGVNLQPIGRWACKRAGYDVDKNEFNDSFDYRRAFGEQRR